MAASQCRVPCQIISVFDTASRLFQFANLRMTELTALEENKILKLSSRDSFADIQRIVETIAQDHGVDWHNWPEWKCNKGWPNLLSWLAPQYDSAAYEAMVEFGFKRSWLAESEPARAPIFFEAFVSSIHALGMAVSHGDEDGEKRASRQAQRGLSVMFIEAGPSGLRAAYAAMDLALSHKRGGWLGWAWHEAVREFERAELGGPATKPGMPGDKETL